MIALSSEPIRKPAANKREVVGWGPRGALYADDIAERSCISTIRLALQEIADAQGDVDSFIAQYEEPVRKVPKIAAEIARRLLAAGRTEEAWQAIEATEHQRGGWPDFEWEDARIDILEALGRGDDAQIAHWSCFERSLSARHLRDYLKRLPEFDDFEAEERALGYAERYGSFLQAISFLVSWPALERAARTVIRRATDLEGNYYEILSPAAEALAAKYPLAATLLLRAMIDFSLTQARASRYGHAARHLQDCAGLAPTIADYGSLRRMRPMSTRCVGNTGGKERSGVWSRKMNCLCLLPVRPPMKSTSLRASLRIGLGVRYRDEPDHCCFRGLALLSSRLSTQL
jgi:hypothetical protein